MKTLKKLALASCAIIAVGSLVYLNQEISNVFELQTENVEAKSFTPEIKQVDYEVAPCPGSKGCCPRGTDDSGSDIYDLGGRN